MLGNTMSLRGKQSSHIFEGISELVKAAVRGGVEFATVVHVTDGYVIGQMTGGKR